MNTFSSQIVRKGSITFPEFSGRRIIIMPFHLENPRGSLPDYLQPWVPTIFEMVMYAPQQEGTAYLTIDEAEVPADETHRRPGIHVDGVGPDGKSSAIWGGPDPAIWSSRPTNTSVGGMLLAASHIGCRGWHQEFQGFPGPDGDCAHLAEQCHPNSEIIMKPYEVYWCNHLGVHEAIPMQKPTQRQLIRISMPSDAPWYMGCTPNPLGILPDGPIVPMRTEQMAYRP